VVATKRCVLCVVLALIHELIFLVSKCRFYLLQFFNIDPSVDESEGDHSSMRQLFSLLDEDESGSLDFREFLVGLALLADSEGSAASVGSGAGESEPTLRLAFEMFSSDGGESVSLEQLQRVFRRAFPEVSQAAVKAVFNDVSTKTPGGSQKASISFEEFKQFCNNHPECVSKFKATILEPAH
jgi:Ca2+-binding EF-hand superfamily protein